MSMKVEWIKDNKQKSQIKERHVFRRREATCLSLHIEKTY
jgi:hypothetical protein